MNNRPSREGGVLFANNRKAQQSHPDFTGNISLSREAVQSIAAQVKSGVEFPTLDLAAWKKVSNGGKNFLSLSAKKPYEKNDSQGSSRQSNNGNSNQFDMDDDIPF